MRTFDGPSKLFVAGLGDNRKDDLAHVFSKYGDVLNVYVDEKKQFAFVEFGSPSEAARALQRVNHLKVNGSRLRVEFARSEKSARESRRSSSRERFASSHAYDHHPQFPIGRSTQVHGYRPNFYPYPPPSVMINSSAISRGRSLTPPSFKKVGRMPPISGDFYPPYPPNFYPEPNFYRSFDNSYYIQRFPPISNRSYGPSFGHREFSRRRSRSRSRSRTNRRVSPPRKERTNRDEKFRRRVSRSVSPRERTPRISHRPRKRSRSSSTENSIVEQKISSPSDNEDDEKQSNTRSSTENSEQKLSRKRRRD